MPYQFSKKFYEKLIKLGNRGTKTKKKNNYKNKNTKTAINNKKKKKK